jgi:hypothetical protein
MAANSIPEPQENALPAGVAPAGPRGTEEVEPEALSILLEFFLLLDKWERQGGRS